MSAYPYILHRDAHNFVFPDVSSLKRWLVASGELCLERALSPVSSPAPEVRFEFVHNDAAFIPFSHGPMNCLGKGLAMLQMRTVVCTLAQRFRIQLEDQGDGEDSENREYLTANRLELPVVLEASW